MAFYLRKMGKGRGRKTNKNIEKKRPYKNDFQLSNIFYPNPKEIMYTLDNHETQKLCWNPKFLQNLEY